MLVEPFCRGMECVLARLAFRWELRRRAFQKRDRPARALHLVPDSRLGRPSAVRFLGDTHTDFEIAMPRRHGVALRVHERLLWFGTGLGFGLWAVAALGMFPLIRVARPAWKPQLEENIAAHLVYGLAIQLLTEEPPRQPTAVPLPPRHLARAERQAGRSPLVPGRAGELGELLIVPPDVVSPVLCQGYPRRPASRREDTA